MKKKAILGIETSCDETALALVSGEGEQLTVEKSVVLSQVQEHAKYGGVVPEVAARQHLEAIFPMLEHEVPSDGAGIDAIAVTQGPGLAPALRIGVEVAKTLAWLWHKPLVPVSHLEGHLYANWLSDGKRAPEFPILALLVSGGHTELILMRGHGDFERLGETLDDAAGEAFDKVAKMLELSYPGGPAISKLAENGNPQAYDFPRGLLDRPDLNFSFSGLKTSVLYTLRKMNPKEQDEPRASYRREPLLPQVRQDIAASFQEAVVDVLIRKTKRAAQRVEPAALMLAGGVAANRALRARFEALASELGCPALIPDFQFATDNAAMIAAAGYFRAQDQRHFASPPALAANPNLEIAK